VFWLERIPITGC